MKNSEVLRIQSELLNDINIENLTEEDIITVIKYNATFSELTSIVEIVEKIEKRSFPSKDPMWAKMCIGLYFYKLGGNAREKKRKSKKKIEEDGIWQRYILNMKMK